ncbi:MAG: hypothetical protein OQK94_00530 [Gammaproteobacteria bacterium]|nr:hypothetical protein [Gammaproteobacteria bacterium]MCW8839960.1 hypothetical protein [Gammaproteobacteria bacterium]MCW8959325.1 hypothetical protein [Gammaproteobacteria bacterium]MCW8993772.1 hypothetical protein [Gammaproteobacteria bacterium]
MDFTAITTAVDFTTVLAALASIAAVFAGVYIARVGFRFVLGMVRKGS